MKPECTTCRYKLQSSHSYPCQFCTTPHQRMWEVHDDYLDAFFAEMEAIYYETDL